jgi:aminotransferase
MELMEIMKRVAETGAVDLAIGVPGFTPDRRLVEYFIAALSRGAHQYEPSAGTPALREAIARWVSLRHGVEVDAANVTVTCGATEGLVVALRAVLDPGDEVIVLEPAYEGFASAADLCGAGVRTVGLHPPAWTFDARALEQSLTGSTRAVIINTPHNPTGKVFSDAELEAIAALCVENDLFCISDEVYEAFAGPSFRSVMKVPGFEDRALAIGSFSKALAVSGWRVGYLITPSALTNRVRVLHQTTTAGAPTPAQYALAELLSDGNAYADVLAANAARVSLNGARAVAMFTSPTVRPLPGAGGCFFLAELDGCAAYEYCQRLIELYGVAVAPGTAFWSDPAIGSRFIRVAFNKAEATIDLAERRLAQGRRKSSSTEPSSGTDAAVDVEGARE